MDDVIQKFIKQTGFDDAEHTGNRGNIDMVLRVNNSLVEQGQRVSQRACTGTGNNIQCFFLITYLFQIHNVFKMFEYKILRNFFKSEMLGT